MSRKITTEAVQAFLQGKNYKNGNTKVSTKGSVVFLSLHNNLIAYKDKNGLFISLAGWNTPTTRERLNGLPGVRVNQKNFIPFLNGKEINSREFYKVS